MFPTSRNSLRRWGDHYQTNVPIPVAVTVHNLMILADKEQKQAKKQNSQWFRPEHNTKLLPKIQLEILVSKEGTGEMTTVYSQTCTGIHPSFEHLDERIELEGEWWSPKRSSTEPKIIKEEEEEESNRSSSSSSSTDSHLNVYKSMIMKFSVVQQDNDNDDDEMKSDSSFNDQSILKDTVFLEVPIYPALLHRLSEIPEALPPNACLVHFTDGSTRLPQNTFQVLLDSKLTGMPPVEDFSRFEDDVFRTLDSVPETPERRRKTDSLLDQETIQLFPPKQENSKNKTTDILPSSVLFDESEEQVLEQDQQNKALLLQEMIEKEEKALQQELTLLHQEKEAMNTLMQETQTLEQQLVLIQRKIENHSKQLKHEEFAQQAQRINLFRDLQTIYPISLDTQKGFLIRDLRLPVDIYTTNVPDEELSNSLGFACHLIFMMSKYLGVGLRHRIVCNSSRSAIQQDGTATAFPLFATRGIERERLDSGLGLLGENVDCILKTLEVEFTPKSHILQRLNRIYEGILQDKSLE